jgi:hypothetical protein
MIDTLKPYAKYTKSGNSEIFHLRKSAQSVDDFSQDNPRASASTVTPVDCVHTHASALAYVDVYSAQSVFHCPPSAFIRVHPWLIFYREMRERGEVAG